MDPIIEEMHRRIVNFGHSPSTHDLRRWALHLTGIVQPELDRLAELEADNARLKADAQKGRGKEKVSA
jgi:hypothetical protein